MSSQPGENDEQTNSGRSYRDYISHFRLHSRRSYAPLPPRDQSVQFPARSVEPVVTPLLKRPPGHNPRYR